MYRVIVRAGVEDYDTWQARHDELLESGVLAERGVREHRAYRDEANPNNVTVMLDFDDAATAQAYVGDPRNKELLAMQGVKLDGLLMSVIEVESGTDSSETDSSETDS